MDQDQKHIRPIKRVIKGSLGYRVIAYTFQLFPVYHAIFREEKDLLVNKCDHLCRLLEQIESDAAALGLTCTFVVPCNCIMIIAYDK